ncbi:MAG TPA: DUF4190 domain-containing protein [Pyrinomonadaceae bacterium]|jgi:hypothetical protein|nr:DUF4190 domain-containing protein [Pyrinomonadaceae bacterium]
MNSFKCPECGLVNWATVEACKRCGVRFAHAPESSAETSYTEGGYQTQSTHAGWQGDSEGAPYSTHYDVGPAYDHNDGARANYYTGPEIKRKTGLAVTSLVLGIIGFFTFGVLGLGALIGTIVGIIALNKSKRNPEEYGGQGLAIGGIITNVLALLSVAPLAIILAIALPNLLASRRAANEASAIFVLKRIAVAENVYQATHSTGAYGTIDELFESGNLDAEVAATMRHGYKFNLKVGKGLTERNNSYEAIATPMHYGEATSTGTRSFYISSEDDEIHAAKGMEVNGRDPAVGPTTIGQGLYPHTRKDETGWSN